MSVAGLLLSEVEALLLQAFVRAEGTRLRVEDLKKARETLALLEELARVGRRGLIVDAAAGHGYVGLLAVKLLGFERAVLLERDEGRVARCVLAAEALGIAERVDARVDDLAATTDTLGAEALVALHACGDASDRVVGLVGRSRPRWAFVVPCCHGRSIPTWEAAGRALEAAGLPSRGELGRRARQLWIDQHRKTTLEGAGYEVVALPFVPPSVSAHNLLLRARRLRA